MHIRERVGEESSKLAEFFPQTVETDRLTYKGQKLDRRRGSKVGSREERPHKVEWPIKIRR